MELKKRFLLLNTMSVLGAILLTALAGVLFTWFYFAFAGTSSVNTVSPENIPVLVFKNDNPVYSSVSFDKIELAKIASIGQDGAATFTRNNVTYHIRNERFTFEDGARGRLVRLIPQSGQNTFYFTLAGFSVGVFLIFFLCANLIVVKYFRRAIINPVIRLQRAARSLSEGDMDFGISEEGQGEVRELCLALEQLRLKLRETLYLQNKVDENRKFLLSTISHDLKTPVTSIKGYIDGILDGVAGTPEKINHYLKTASDKTVQLNAMIDDLLLYSKLDLEQIPYHFQRLELTKFLTQCIAADALAYSKEGKSIVLPNRAPEDIYVVIDAEQFRRVHQNIADNAKKYIPAETGCLTVGIRETHTSVIIEYKDNGTGIKPEDLPHIFDRFYRGDVSRKTNGSSGLGLAIAKNIVEGHGGRIWAVSEEGQGAAILISLKKA